MTDFRSKLTLALEAAGCLTDHGTRVLASTKDVLDVVCGDLVQPDGSQPRWSKTWDGRETVNLAGDAFVKVWQDGEWTIIHSRSGGLETTISLKDYQAFEIAFALTRELLARFERARTAENALYTLTHPNADPTILRKLADEMDCGVDCELRRSSGPCSRAEKDGMCGFESAHDLREFADALERKAAASQEDQTNG